MGSLTDFERGLLAGLLIGEGHFGVDRGRRRTSSSACTSRHEYSAAAGSRTSCPVRVSMGRITGEAGLLPPHGPRAALRSLLDIFDSLEFDRWCPHVAGGIRDASGRCDMRVDPRRHGTVS